MKQNVLIKHFVLARKKVLISVNLLAMTRWGRPALLAWQRHLQEAPKGVPFEWWCSEWAKGVMPPRRWQPRRLRGIASQGSNPKISSKNTLKRRFTLFRSYLFFLLECLKVFQNFFFLILKVVHTCLMNNIPYIVTCMLCYMFSHCYMYVMLHVFSMLHVCYVTCSLIVTCMLPTY